jgi:hypothetical protein
MQRFTLTIQRNRSLNALFSVLGMALLPMNSQAIPIFARQTGQNCVACHAGGQFPELTPYGRKFKLTGYTLGDRPAVPLAVMGTVSMAKVKSTTPGTGDAQADFPQNGGYPHFTTASLFAGGKISDNIGLFGQWTYNAYNGGPDSYTQGHSSSDQFDLRFSDRFIDSNRDLIIGASLNNNPGVTDVWNTFSGAFASMPGYVPAGNPSGKFNVPVAPILQGLATTAGLNVYAYLNDTLYAEMGAYQSANKAFSFLSQGISDANTTKLKGHTNPYVRLALNHDWGANSAMVGIYGMNAEKYNDPLDTTSPTNHYRDTGIDAQYQYILDPYMVSAQFSYTREKQSYDASLVGYDASVVPVGLGYDNASNTLNHLRLKATYILHAKYGASLGYTTVKGSADTQLYQGDMTGATPFAYGNNTPDTRIWIPEVFWTPIQNVRVGAQYYKFTKYNGSSSNYDGNLRNASDNNTFFFYIWGAY